MAISDNNQIVVSGSDDKTVRIWNLPNKQQEAIFKGHKSKVNLVSIINDNLYFSVSLSELIIWNLNDKNSLVELPFNIVHAISNDETICILTQDIYAKKLCIWNLKEKLQVAVLEGHEEKVNSVAIANSNQFFVSAFSDSIVRLWNIPEKRLEEELKGHLYSVNCIALTSNDKFAVSGSDDRNIIIWDLIKKEKVAVLSGQKNEINFIAITSDNIIISILAKNAFRSNNLIIWNFDDKKQILKTTEYITNATCICTLECSAIIGNDEGKIINLNTKRKSKVTSNYLFNKNAVKSVGLTSNEKFLISEYFDNTVIVWDQELNKKKTILKASDNIPFTKVYVSKSHNKVYLSSGFGVSIYDIDENVINHMLTFDGNFENFYIQDSTFEELLMPRIIYCD